MPAVLFQLNPEARGLISNRQEITVMIYQQIIPTCQWDRMEFLPYVKGMNITANPPWSIKTALTNNGL